MKLQFIILLFVSTLLAGCSSPERINPITGGMNILFCGDVMLDWGIKEIFEDEGPEYTLKRLQNLLKDFDYRFCNLECPISINGEPHPEKKYIFQAKPEQIEILKYGNINGVSLANNHSNDFGQIALFETMANLKNNEISYAGAGMDIGAAHLPISIDIRNIQLAIFAYSCIAYPDSFATNTAPGIAKADIDLIREDIQQFKKFNDFIIISLHWGREYSDFPTIEQIELAHEIIDSGADGIIGHHPHVYQGIEIYKGKPIIYSLGNFIFGSINEDIRDNIVAGIRFLKSGMLSLSIYPINGNKDTRTRFRHELLEGEAALGALNHLLRVSKQLGTAFVERAVIKDSILTYNFYEESDTVSNLQ